MKIFESDFISTQIVSTNNQKRPIVINGHISYTKNDKYVSVIPVVMAQLKPIEGLEKDAPYRIEYDFFCARVDADADNMIKSFQDILQQKYGINDRNFYEIVARKFPVGKKNEGVIFRIFKIKIPKIKNNFKITKDKNVRSEYYD
jgi:Holliday junction resolvase RusA-like endonuclease